MSPVRRRKHLLHGLGLPEPRLQQQLRVRRAVVHGFRQKRLRIRHGLRRLLLAQVFDRTSVRSSGRLCESSVPRGRLPGAELYRYRPKWQRIRRRLRRDVPALRGGPHVQWRQRLRELRLHGRAVSGSDLHGRSQKQQRNGRGLRRSELRTLHNRKDVFRPHRLRVTRVRWRRLHDAGVQ
jgi:hypothetical protein